MSRARPIYLPSGREQWFDTKKNSEKATAYQLELLADVEDLDLDDLLDEGLSQADVIKRLRKTLNQGVIPEEVLERRRERRLHAQQQPQCVICETEHWTCEGFTTRHHYVPKWLMRELSQYQAYAARSICTVRICVGRHRDLHLKDDSDKSIARYLNEQQQALVQKMLDELKQERPIIFDLILGGDESRYEYQLIRDYTTGKFRSSTNSL